MLPAVDEVKNIDKKNYLINQIKKFISYISNLKKKVHISALMFSGLDYINKYVLSVMIDLFFYIKYIRASKLFL